MPEQMLLKWMAPSRPFKLRDKQFFTTAVAIVILVSIILAFAGEWMLIAVLAAICFAYYVWSTVPPEEAEYAVTDRGIRAHGQLYRHEELSAWWIDSKLGQQVLVVDAPLVAGRRLHLVLKDVTLGQLTETLGKHLIMEKPEATSMDRVSAWVSEKFPLEAK